MGRKLVVSSGDALRVISLEHGEEALRVPLDRAGALCVSESQVFCASGNVIWQLDKEHLTPTGLFGGGPDMRSLMLSADETRLFALCSEADSVLMLSAQTGEPMLLNRAGVNPQEMALDGGLLTIAGGESGLILFLCAHSLRLLHAISMPGPVYSVALREGTLHALCLTAELSSLLVTQRRGGTSRMLELAGMPGRLLLRKDCLLAATDGALYTVSSDGGCVIKHERIPGRAVWMAEDGKETLLLDGYTETLYAAGESSVRQIARQTAFAALCRV